VFWLVFSLSVVVAIAGLWWFAMRRRHQKPPQPARPYREWKD
jgi:hypothetical protein